MPEFLSQPSVEIARRLDIRGGNAWIAVLSPPAAPDAALDELRTELRSILQVSTRVLSIESASFEGLRRALQHPNDDAVILSAGVGVSQDKWLSLDLMRSALERPGPVILCLVSNEIANLTAYAPNIRSFIGPSIFMAAPDGGIMTDDERGRRLEELRAHYEMGDDEIIRRAESKELPTEPEFVEWLVLLGRGDLV